MRVLQIRLQNCLRTILETEPDMTRNFRASLAADFAELRSYLTRLEGMSLAEEDVERMERLTDAFLRQAAHACAGPVAPRRRVQ